MRDRDYSDDTDHINARITVELIRDQLEHLGNWEKEHKVGISVILGLLSVDLDNIKRIIKRKQLNDEQEIQIRSTQDESGMAGEEI